MAQIEKKDITKQGSTALKGILSILVLLKLIDKIISEKNLKRRMEE